MIGSDRDHFIEEPTDVEAPLRGVELVATRRVSWDEELGPGDTVGEYVVERKLRDTPVGALYLARHPVVGKEAAIKVVRRWLCARPDTLSHLADGARELNQLAHPNVGQVFAFGPLPDGRCYFALDWWRGETLAERLHRGPIPMAESLEILDEICRGLGAAHDQAVLHRDLRPENIFLVERRAGGEGGRVKLYDFALGALDRAGSGRPLYCPPEQVQGKDYDTRSEVYALGAMAYEMLAGEPPFQADDPIDLMALHLTKTAARLRQKNPAVPQPLEELVGKMMAKVPSKRPSLREVRAALAPMHRRRAEGVTGEIPRMAPERASLPLPAPVSPVPVYLGTPERRRRARPVAWRRWAAIAGGAVALLVAGKLVFGGGQVPRPVAPAANLVPALTATSPVAATPARAPAMSMGPADQIGTLVVRVAWADGEVVVDGQVVARGGGVVRLPAVTAGTHEVTVTGPAGEVFRRVVMVAAGAEVELVVGETPRTAAPSREPAPEPRRARRDRESKEARRGKPRAERPEQARPTPAASPDGLINPFGSR